jgi:hypothetical protein
MILRDYGFHVLALSDAVDAIEHVENLCFDVAVVSDEMPSTLPELLFSPIDRTGLRFWSAKPPKSGSWRTSCSPLAKLPKKETGCATS